jgi:hypothetical protein
MQRVILIERIVQHRETELLDSRDWRTLNLVILVQSLYGVLIVNNPANLMLTARVGNMRLTEPWSRGAIR